MEGEREREGEKRGIIRDKGREGERGVRRERRETE